MGLPKGLRQRTDSVKGRSLWADAQHVGLTLVTDPQQPTRTGNSVSIDTTPDLTFTKNAPDPKWVNTQKGLGSYHFIIATTLNTGPTKKRGRKLTMVEWDTFRQIQGSERESDHEDEHEEARNSTTYATTITDIERWTAQLHRAVKQATKEIPEEAGLETADSKLLHLWEARDSLQEKWRGQRLNRNLRRRIARLDRDIEDHANRLARQQWESTCSSMEGQLGLRKAWNLLRCLLDPDSSKTLQRQNLNKITHTYNGTDEMQNRYIGTTTRETQEDYTGKDNPTLDEEITEAEVRAEILRLRTESAPGPDGITNKTLRNLNDESIEAITRYMNECWERGEIPQQWKTAQVVMISKPGKKLQIENLRPISLTSCVGKLMEHVVLTRLNNHMEDRGLYPHTMIGFRPHLSTQDVMLQIKHQILDARGRTAGLKAILGLDLTKAFDNVTHKAVLENLRDLGVGRKAYTYVRDFLSNRTAKLSIGDIKSEEIELGSRGTPQG